MPQIELNTICNIDFSNLIEDVVNIDFNEYFTYPYMDKVNIRTSFNLFDCNIEGYGVNSLEIIANVRDTFYPINIVVEDKELNRSNEDLILNFQEKAPIYINDPFQSLTISRKRYTCNLDLFVGSNIDKQIEYSHEILSKFFLYIIQE